MESRASYLMVGGFVLAIIAAAFTFVVWLTQARVNQEFSHYDIYFTGSVAGLAVGGDVRYRGIRIGQVNDIDIDPSDPERVLVIIKVDGGTPIRRDDQASLQLQGITGVSYVNIEGASADSPLLVREPGQARAQIPSTPSAMEQLVTGAPDLLASAVDLMGRVGQLLNDENQAAVGRILADVQALSGSLAGRRGQITGILDSLDQLSGQLVVLGESATRMANTLDGLSQDASATMRNLRTASAGAEELLREDVRALVAELRGSAGEINRFARTANAVLAENREPLSTFTGEGLQQFSEFLSEASVLVNSISRLTERLDNEGARFLIGAQQSEFEVGGQ